MLASLAQKLQGLWKNRPPSASYQSWLWPYDKNSKVYEYITTSDLSTKENIYPWATMKAGIWVPHELPDDGGVP